MKITIENKLNKLIGLPLKHAGRAANLVWFGFGEFVEITTMIGLKREVPEYALHVECSFRITQCNKIVVASGDIYTPSSQWEGEDEDFDWDVQGINRFDERIKIFNNINQSKLIVENIQGDIIGGAKIFLTNPYLLEMFPDDSNLSEKWRFFNVRSQEPHFVVRGNKFNF